MKQSDSVREWARSGAEALVEALKKAGTEILFGYPGGNVLPVFNVLAQSGLRLVLGRHEQGCVHMADGFARALGRPGVVLVTSGPGLTNTITGLGAANMDGVPLVLVCGQVPLDQIGTDAFQEADTTGLTRAVSKHNFLVHSADEIPETVAQAFYIATHGKPGPVVIDIPRDCQEALTAAQYPERVALRAYHPESTATTSQVNRFAKLVNESRRPVLYAGGGVIASGAADDVAALARKAQLPVATTLMGIGSFAESDPLSLGLAGVHGSYAANRAIAEADLVLALGVRFNDRITGRVSKYARCAKIVHVDCDPASIDKNVRVALGIVADVKDLLATVSSRVCHAEHADWLAVIDAWRREHPEAWPASHGGAAGAIPPQAVVASLRRATKGAAIVVTDVGQHQMWTAKGYGFSRPRRFLTSGGMGAMGFGIPAAIGAAIARPECKVVAVLGDGGAQMTAEELVVAAEEELSVTFVVVNNGGLGMVRQMQAMAGVPAFGVTPRAPDFVKLAAAYGVPARRVTDLARLDAAIAQAVRATGPRLVEVVVDREANVWPTACAGGALTEMRFS